MRSTVLIGLFFIVIAIAALLIVVVVPILPGSADNPTVLNLMAVLVCQPGERASIEVLVTHDEDGTGYTPDVTCIGREGETSNQTGKLFVIGAGIFIVTLLPGILLINIGARRSRSSRKGSLSDLQEIVRALNTQGTSSTVFSNLDAGLSSDFRGNTAQSPNTADLVSKLKQLEQARDGGLITQQEYDRLRQEILDKMA
jgi:hypothetical protein